MEWKRLGSYLVILAIAGTAFFIAVNAPRGTESDVDPTLSPAAPQRAVETVVITVVVVQSPTHAPALATAAAANAARAVNDARVAEAKRLAAESDLAMQHQAATATVAGYLAEQTRVYAQQTVESQVAELQLTAAAVDATVTAEFVEMARVAEETRIANDVIRSEKRADTITFGVVVLIWVGVIGILALISVIIYKLFKSQNLGRELSLAIASLRGRIDNVVDVLAPTDNGKAYDLHLAGPSEQVPMSTWPNDGSDIQTVPILRRATFGEIRELLNAAIEAGSLAQNKIVDRTNHGAGWWKRIMEQLETDGQVHMEGNSYVPKPGPRESFRTIGDVLRWYDEQWGVVEHSPPAPKGADDFAL